VRVIGANALVHTIHIPGRHRPESVVAINRNAWTSSIGIGGRHQAERPPQLQNRPDIQPNNRFEPVDWNTALNPTAPFDAQDVFWVDRCRIEIMNGFKRDLEKTFPTVDVAAGLAIVPSGET
jgi:hypothetical protein